jgi:hypothetical protein
MRRRFRRGRGDTGMAVVIAAILTTVIMLFVAFAIDGGTAYVAHRSTQNAADSGAMAGARALEQLKFFPVCSTFVPRPCTTFTTTSALRDEILREARNSGADTSAGGVTCYLLENDGTQSSIDLCASNNGPGPITLNASSGVEVHARQTNDTYFAGVAGMSQTEANSVAKAFVSNFAGGTGSPFITCGIQETMPANTANPLEWAYDLARPNGSGGYTVNQAMVGRYFQIQGSDNPTCGAASNTFKGLGDGLEIGSVPTYTGIVGGNRFESHADLSIAGLAACPQGNSQLELNGCGMLIPVADRADGSGTTTRMHVVTWLAWQVWGSGNSYSFGDSHVPVGTTCGNPIAPGGDMKYCGRLLGAVSVTGGSTSGPGTAGQPHVLKLSA